jgi:Eukaryotic protein of unknown function (DUF866)
LIPGYVSFFVGANVRIENIFIQGIWKCVGIDSGTPFPEVDLDHGEWVDYDEKVVFLTFHRAISQPTDSFCTGRAPCRDIRN